MLSLSSRWEKFTHFGIAPGRPPLDDLEVPVNRHGKLDSSGSILSVNSTTFLAGRHNKASTQKAKTWKNKSMHIFAKWSRRWAFRPRRPPDSGSPCPHGSICAHQNKQDKFKTNIGIPKRHIKHIRHLWIIMNPHKPIQSGFIIGILNWGWGRSWILPQQRNWRLRVFIFGGGRQSAKITSHKYS
jgi:hypothetical protein